ncbi:nitrite reductase small subunit NirD [Alkalihalobacillus trypoxylicola]|uniref:Nitrite reductase n=1 Tax=Alkalihalobacillus trypoxylicola TaxID=519424 RepID=A0A162DPP9_9BACI|nr:nitrite reductase small subunit NirD [Alkalihalobacillus trypoxylicola]KYG30494.1 nitrite reductase [Alkalihalobacillus trypoxylicola]GAF64855.1 nitrite reductase NAD(P)H small subunit [Bacillus sp. TS-2]
MSVQASKKIFVINLDELNVGLGKVVTIDGKEIALFLQENGTVHAIENSCPHKGGPLSEGIVSGEFVFCPLHDWKISTKTGMAEGADEGCVTCFDIEINGEQVFVNL